jgi:tetratricopeptide (TPR) repeat protein
MMKVFHDQLHRGRKHKLNKKEDAEENFKLAIILNPINPLAHNSYGYFLLKLPCTKDKESNLNKAIKHFKKAILCADSADFPLAHYNLGYAYYQLGKERKNIKEKRKKKCKRDDNNESDGYFRFSIECLDDALEADPTFVYAWATKGVVLNSLEKYHDAIDCFDKALSIPESKIFDVEDSDESRGSVSRVDALFAKGYAFYYLRRNKEAQECFDKVKNILEKEENPPHSNAYFNALYYSGNNLFYLEEYKDAIEHFGTVLKRCPKYLLCFHSLLSRGQCLYKIAKYSIAIHDFSQAKCLLDDKKEEFNLEDEDGFRAEIHNNIGLCYYQYSNFEDAEKEYKEALDISKNSDSPKAKKAQSIIYYNLGVLYNQTDKLEEAKGNLQASSDRDPNFTKANEALRKLESQRRTK